MFNESPESAWQLRFGTTPSDLPDLGAFLNHRSVRKFKEEAVSESLIAGLIAAAQSAATSSNLGLWSVISVQDPTNRAEIARLTGDQSQVIAAPWFFAFLADQNRLWQAAQRVGESGAGLDFNEFYTMAVIDAALAAERMVCAAESLGLGTCYIGALRNDPYAIRELLNLPDRVVAVFGLCLGWPDESAPAKIKPRLSPESVWFRETYDQNVSVAEYDRRMSEFYLSEGMKGDVTWSMRSARRVDGNHMTGREVLKDFLAEQKLDIR